jgi:hypothetical protein
VVKVERQSILEQAAQRVVQHADFFFIIRQEDAPALSVLLSDNFEK